MLRHVSLIVLLVLGLVGCASDPVPPGGPDDHPASAAANIAPLPASTATLAIVQPVTVTPMPAMQMEHSTGHAKPSSDAKPVEHDGMKGRDADQGEQMQDHSTMQPSEMGTMASPAAPVYVCPMHPEVTSSDSTARCPKCGMKLKARQIEEVTK